MKCLQFHINGKKKSRAMASLKNYCSQSVQQLTIIANQCSSCNRTNQISFIVLYKWPKLKYAMTLDIRIAEAVITYTDYYGEETQGRLVLGASERKGIIATDTFSPHALIVIAAIACPRIIYTRRYNFAQHFIALYTANSDCDT